MEIHDEFQSCGEIFSVLTLDQTDLVQMKCVISFSSIISRIASMTERAMRPHLSLYILMSTASCVTMFS